MIKFISYFSPVSTLSGEDIFTTSGEPSLLRIDSALITSKFLILLLKVSILTICLELRLYISLLISVFDVTATFKNVLFSFVLIFLIDHLESL